MLTTHEATTTRRGVGGAARATSMAEATTPCRVTFHPEQTFRIKTSVP